MPIFNHDLNRWEDIQGNPVEDVRPYSFEEYIVHKILGNGRIEHTIPRKPRWEFVSRYVTNEELPLILAEMNRQVEDNQEKMPDKNDFILNTAQPTAQWVNAPKWWETQDAGDINSQYGYVYNGSSTFSPSLTLNKYQDEASKTSGEINIGRSDIYPLIGLAGEAGELLNKVKKEFRDEADHSDAIKDELGDILWYLADFASKRGWTLEDVGKRNLAKIRDRKERGKIHGDGDNR